MSTNTQEIREESVQIQVRDGTTMNAYIARPAEPSSTPRPGLVLFQEIFGVNRHIRSVGARLAREGYVVLAPDLFHRTNPGYEAGYEDIPASIAVAMKYGAEQSEPDVVAAVEKLASLEGVSADKLGAIGFCMGGTLSFTANALTKLRCAVSYYGGGIATGKIHMAPSLSGPMLFYWAGRDPYIPAEHRAAVADALTRADKPFIDVLFSGQNHGFFCDARSDYDAVAAAQSWELTRAFLKTYLEP